MFCSSIIRFKLTYLIQNIITYNVLALRGFSESAKPIIELKINLTNTQ